MAMTEKTNRPTKTTEAKLLSLPTPAKEKASGHAVADAVDVAEGVTTKVMIAVADAVVEGAAVEVAVAAETMVAAVTTGVDAVVAIDLVEFAASHPARKLWKAQLKAFSNFTPNSTASCGIRRRTISLRNLTRSCQAHLLRKPGCGKA